MVTRVRQQQVACPLCDDVSVCVTVCVELIQLESKMLISPVDSCVCYLLSA